jgi:formiminoglutamate deiminase
VKPNRNPAEAKSSTLWFGSALLPHGWTRQVRLSIQAGQIHALETGVPPHPGDERHGIALPGMPNLHSHAFQRAIAGLTSRRGPAADSFWTWREVMYRFVERLLPEDVEAISAQAYIEMLEAGFTRVGEFHYLHHAPDGSRYTNLAEHGERITAAARETGIGLTLLPVFYAHSGFGGAAPRSAQRRFVCALDEFARLLEALQSVTAPVEDAVVGVAPHSLRAVTPPELSTLIDLAARQPLHIHVAEQASEVSDCLAWCGQTPVAWLLDHAPVDSRWCLVHATHMDASETSRLARSGAVAGLCPITEADLGDGIFPAVAYLGAGGAFGIGSDSNVLIDLAQELRCLEYGQRLLHQSRNVLASAPNTSTGRTLFEQACAGGRQALTPKAAALEVGAPADIITLNSAHPSLVGRSGDVLLDSWIFAAREGLVDHVWRRGRCVVKSGKHVARDVIAERYTRSLRRLLE